MTSISISCYKQASKQGCGRVIELPLAGWNVAQLADTEKKKAKQMYNSYSLLFPNKLGEQNNFKEPPAQI